MDKPQITKFKNSCYLNLSFENYLNFELWILDFKHAPVNGTIFFKTQ
jgi:hypothetical protein